MLSPRVTFYAALTMGVLSAGIASATTFTFDQASADAASASFTEDGVTVTVTAGQCQPLDVLPDGCGAVQVTQESEGLGVRGFGGPVPPIFLDNDPDIDSFPGDEYLIFTFDTLVELEQIVFGDLNQQGTQFPDEYELYADFGMGLEQFVFGGDANPYIFAPGAVTDTLIVGAENSDLLNDFGDGFKVASITLTAIPLPATGLLLLAGVGGLAAMRRRKGA